MKNINLKPLFDSANKAKVEYPEIAGQIDLIILELEKISLDHTHVYSEFLRWMRVDSMPWGVPFLNELSQFLDVHDRYHAAMKKLKNSDQKK